MYAVFLIFGAYAFRKIRAAQTLEQVSLVSILAAAIFAAQMLNWPLPGGTSLHFVGGALAGIMLGPWLGFLTLFLVLFIQALVFHDGGITTLGANVFNMAIVDVIIGYLTYRAFTKILGDKDSVRVTAAFVGGWLGMTLAGAACGLEIGYSPSFPYGFAVTLPVMVVWHIILGIIEGAITALAIVYLTHRAPQLITPEAGAKA